MAPFYLVVVLLATVAYYYATAEQQQHLCSGRFPDDINVGVAGDTCYAFVHSMELSFFESELTCEDHGGTLATVKSSGTNEFLTVFLRDMLKTKEPYWIGLSDQRREGMYLWVDGTELSSTTYRHFAPGYGGYDMSGLDSCVALEADGYWYDYFCHTDDTHSLTKTQFICQWKAAAGSTSTPPSTQPATTAATPKLNTVSTPQATQ